MLKLLLPLVVISAVQAEDYVHNPIQYHSQTPKGSYNYGYDTGLFGSHSFHQEKKDKNGQVRGRYGYTDPDGNLRLTYYTAGPQGFNVVKDTPSPASVPAFRTHSDVTHHDDRPVVHVSPHSRPVPADCKYRTPPCTQKTQQHIDQRVDDKVSVSYSTSSKATHHLEKQTLVVEPGREVVHHATVVHNEPSPPQEHRHHHSHHRNHDVHEGIVRVPLPAITPVEPALQSAPLVIHEKTTHHLSKTVVEPVPVKTVQHHQVTKVHEPVNIVQHQQVTKVHEPVKTVQHHQVRIQETVKAPPAPVKQSLVQAVQKSYFSPSELFRSKAEHRDQLVITSSEGGKGRHTANYKASSPYSRCYCV